MNKTQTQQEITDFFKRTSFTAEQVKKIRTLAMKFNIKLGAHRKQFCKKCLSQIKGKIRITKTHKTVTCQNCNYQNKIKI